MALSDTTKINISIKKLSGKAQTSNDKDLANEGLPTGLTLSSETIFGDVIPTNPSKASLYATTGGAVEYLRLSASFIPGTDTASGRHGFSLQLPDDYEANSSNSKKGTYPFLNSQIIYITSGSLQLVPTSFSMDYESIPYHSASNVQTQIPVLDARDWNLDYFNGIFFQQDPPATGDSNQNPRYVDAFLYIGASVKDKITGGGSGGDPNAEYLVLSATGSLSDERVFTPGIGLASVDAGAGNAYTLNILDSVVATLTGSQFSGNVGITGSLGAAGNMHLGEYLYHKNDPDTFLRFESDQITFSAGNETLLTLKEHSQDTVIIGDGGDVDFQVKTSGDDNTLYIRGDTNRVGIGLNGPATTLHIKDSDPGVRIQREAQAEDGTLDFAGAAGVTGASIVHVGNTNDLVFNVFNGSTVEEILRMGDYYNSNKRQVIFLSGSGMHSAAIQPEKCSDIAFFVSGSAGSKGTTTRGTSVFGGDVVISGTLHGGSPLKVAGGLAVTGSLDINPELGDVARIQNLKGKVKVFASSSLELGSYTGIIDLFDLHNGACGQLKMSGSAELTKRTITLSSPGTLFFTGSDGGSNFKGPIHASDGLSGSLTRLQGGSSYLIGGAGINISSASNGSITIGFKNQERVKSIRIINSPIGAGQDCDISANFSNVNYDFNKVDVFVNGQLLLSGSLKDYLLNTAKTGSIHFNFDLLTDDAITTVVSI